MQPNLLGILFLYVVPLSARRSFGIQDATGSSSQQCVVDIKLKLEKREKKPKLEKKLEKRGTNPVFSELTTDA